jgi:hypothetical protein
MTQLKLRLRYIAFALLLTAAPALAQQIVQSPDPVPENSGSASASTDSAPASTDSAPASTDAATPATTQAATPSSGGNFFERWQARATATQAKQPGWSGPVFAPYPMLVQIFRNDFDRQILPTGYTNWNLGSNKGLIFIPFANTEITISTPPYVVHSAPNTVNGFGDMGFYGKYRILTTTKHSGAMLSFLLLSTIPTGDHKNGSLDAVITPTLAGGKGFGRFDLQSCLGIALPLGHTSKLGRPIPWNTTLQYHAGKYLWPEIESNATFYDGGPNHGKTQEFLTPGLMISKIKLHASDPHSRLGLAFGTGMQIATSSFHTFNHQLVFSTRFLF